MVYLKIEGTGWWQRTPLNLSTQKAEVGPSLSLRPTWATERVPRQPALHSETLS